MKKLAFVVLVCIASSLIQSSASAQEGMGGRGGRGGFRAMLEKNRAVVTRLYSMCNAGQFDSLAAICSKDLVDHNPDQGQKPALAGMIEMLKGYASAFPDMKMTVNDMVTEGDKVAVRVTVEGTNKGPMNGMPPTGKKFSVSMMEEFVVKDGMLTDRYGVFDAANMMVQLGMMPAPGDTTKKK